MFAKNANYFHLRENIVLETERNVSTTTNILFSFPHKMSQSECHQVLFNRTDRTNSDFENYEKAAIPSLVE